jgi:NitT/TauT family transport system substrate-binding protein
MEMKIRIRSKVIALLSIVAMLAVVLTGCSSNTASTTPSPDGAGEDLVLRIGWEGILCEAPLHIAVEKGFFEQEGLKVETIKLATGTKFDSITADKIDAGFSLLASLVQPLSNGLPAKITTGLHTGCDKVITKDSSGITKPADFVGKTVGVPSYTSSPYIYTKRVLADSGLSVGAENPEVNFVVYSSADLPLALINGAVDAIALNDPTATIAVKGNAGFVTIMDSAIDAPYKDQFCCAAYVRENIVREHADIALKYTTAMQKASAWVQENPDETAQIQVDNKWVAGDALVNAEVLKNFSFIPSYQGAYDAFAVIGPQMQDVGLIPADVDVEALQKNSFAQLEGVPYK